MGGPEPILPGEASSQEGTGALDGLTEPGGEGLSGPGSIESDAQRMLGGVQHMDHAGAGLKVGEDAEGVDPRGLTVRAVQCRPSTPDRDRAVPAHAEVAPLRDGLSSLEGQLLRGDPVV